MSPHFRTAGLCLVVLGLAACGAVRTISYHQPYPANSARAFLAWAGGAGPVLVEVRGNPFSAPQQTVERAIADSSSGVVTGMSAIRFTADRAEVSHPEWRVVYDFNAAPSTGSASICDSTRPTPRQGGSETLSALVVFCNENRPISSASVWSPPIQGPGTPEFRQLAQQSMATLFEPEFLGSDTGIDFPF